MHISVENLKIRYASYQPDVLHDVSFEATPHEKIAVVGNYANSLLKVELEQGNQPCR